MPVGVGALATGVFAEKGGGGVGVEMAVLEAAGVDTGTFFITWGGRRAAVGRLEGCKVCGGINCC